MWFQLLADILVMFQKINGDLKRGTLTTFPEGQLTERFGKLPAGMGKTWQSVYETLLLELLNKSFPLKTNWAQFAYMLKPILIPTTMIR